MTYKQYYKNRDVISFFSGAMGLDIGLQNAGLNVKIGQDFDMACLDTMQANGHKVIGGDIRNIAPEDMLNAAGLSIGEPFLVCGGPPCQPFSTAGKRLGINDPRGSLFMDFIRMIDYIRPRFFIMENVKGLMSAPLKHIPHADRSNDKITDEERLGTVLDVVLGEFKRLGYKTVYGILDAVNYGVPQFRERFVLIGSRDSEEIFLPIPTHFQFHQDRQYQWITLKEAIGDLENETGECASFGAERTRLLELIPQGGNWRDLPLDLVEQAMGGAYQSGGGKVGFYRRLSYSQPAPTLVTSPIQKASMLCHPTQNRPLSVREYARIQQFPDNWRFTGTVAAKYRQIGNAVPVGLAKALGQAILSVADETAEIKTKRVRGTDVHNKIKQAMVLGGYANAN
ncbi:DNA cytosine methyltransferase [Paenibacillus sp. YN15]|uniref:DNA cytosine methyltransferase n=1 Tax=Paenibacillus sp. YN15 TaxID=1742774 RepID=UPI00215D59C5|nr:DNA cytosine methyltransferase [Paenibacillus sp. YN15]